MARARLECLPGMPPPDRPGIPEGVRNDPASRACDRHGRRQLGGHRSRCGGGVLRNLRPTAVGARLSTTSEGLWLTAALAGVTRLPSVLKVRPVGDVDATLASHGGMAVLETAGVCRDGVLDPDVADWMLTLGRPDIELAIMMSRPEAKPDRLLGPPPVFEAPSDPVDAARALAQWRMRQPAQRAAALCRRIGWWVAASRVWRAGTEDLDEIVVSPLGQA